MKEKKKAFWGWKNGDSSNSKEHRLVINRKQPKTFENFADWKQQNVIKLGDKRFWMQSMRIIDRQ